MINANEFYESSLSKQREYVNGEIEIHMEYKIYNPVISLDFDVYPVIREEMEKAGWVYESYYNIQKKRKCARFFPKQYKPE